MATNSKMFVHYSGTKAAFIAAGLPATYTNKIVFISGDKAGNGAAVYTHGKYYGNLEEAIVALKFFSKISAGGTTAEAAGNNGTINFSADDPASVEVKVDSTGVHFGLTNAFKQAVNTDLPNRIKAIEDDYLTSADNTAIEGKISAAQQAAEAKAQAEREQYRELVDEEIERCIPILLAISGDIKNSKAQVMDNFKTILEMKSELFKTKIKDDQRSHTFTNSEGNKRITLGVYVTDGYRDTVEDGIAIVKEYISSLANDEKTEALVNMVFRLLARDAKGTLKASRIVQLRKVAQDTGDERFLEGVRIIEESYQPEVSKQFIRAEIKNENGMWKPIPLGMTES